MSSKFNKKYGMFAIAIIALVVFIFIMAVLYGKKEEKKTKNDENATKSLDIPTEIGPAGTSASGPGSTGTSSHPIRDYYVKSSFNSCAGGIGQKDWVGFKPLEHVIKRGARMLDFEIVSKNGEPFICTSSNTISSDKNALCGTYNTLTFKEVMSFVAANAFAGVNKCPNGDDPLFLNLRIKTANSNIYPIMTDVLKEAFKGKLLNRTFNLHNINKGNKLISKPLRTLRRKVIIFCHDIYRGYNNQQTPDIREIINLDGMAQDGKGSKYLKVWQKGTTQSLELTHDLDNDKHYVKQTGLGMIYPNIMRTSTNLNEEKINTYLNNGFQFIFMNYQNYDDGLTYYESIFDDVGSAFKLKPNNLRFTERFIELKADPSKKVEFKTTPTETVIPGYNPEI
tara:strand:+ start:493 stop:1677 length:1185 start_codon:yes stop_codon:yes gene_type:complete